MHFHICQDEIAVAVQVLSHVGGVLTQVRVWVWSMTRRMIKRYVRS